jgi:polyisoprenoid-binding protein YceI
MKKILFLHFAALFIIHVSAQNFSPIDNGSTVSFSIKNFGITVNGSFKGLEGNIIFNQANIASSSFNVTVKSATVNTDNNSRDNHLRKEDYFNVASFPTINLISTKVSNSTKAGTYIIDAILTIKGTKKNISFPFTVSPNANGYLFSGSFIINRRDFNVGGSSMILSDKLTVSLNVLSKKN